MVPEGEWLCEICAAGREGREAVCALCNRKGGPMKKSTGGSRYCHVVCAIATPELLISDMRADDRKEWVGSNRKDH